MDGKKCPEVSDTPTPKLLNNSDDVIEFIRSWIQQLDTKSKMHEDAVKHIESFVDRQISCLESTVVERQYVKVVLEMWLRKSLRKAFDYLNDETIDISVEMPTLLKELNSVNSFEDIGLTLNDAACQLMTNLCDAGCQYLQLILDQVDLFKNTPRFSVLVASYFKQFKASCIGKVFSRCLDDVGKDQTNGKRNRELIVTLNALLQVASKDVGIQNVLEKSFAGKDVKDFDDANGKDLINQLVEIFESCSVTSKNESSEWFNELKSEKECEPKLQVSIKETCKAFLFPKTAIEIKEEYGRKIIFIKGVSVFVSKFIEEMQRLKENNPEVQEIQMIGLSSVHIDCHLENETWHGTNVGIVADKIFVDCEVCRKDRKNNAQMKEETTESKEAYHVAGHFCVCWDVSGKNGEPGRPGTSGGNVHVICNEMFNAERWKIISDGGDGGDGKNGTNGEGKPDRKASKWSKEHFNQAFPSMSIFETGEQTDDKIPGDAVKTVLTTLNDLLPVENRKSGEDIQPDYRGNFFIEGTAKDGSEITVSYYQSKTKRHTLILCRGSSIGQGGSGGTMIFEFMTGENSFALESSVPVVGKENRQPRAVRMGVYQATGSNGAMGTPVGDVGFVHRLDTSEASADQNLTGHYIGFENDVRLRMEHHRTKPTRQPNDPDNYYAKLKKGEYASIAYRGLSAYGQVQPLYSAVVNATKKKGIVRQSLVHHFFQVDEWQQMTQSLQEKLYNDWEKQKLAEDVDFLVSQMEDKETQLYQVSSRCSRGLENIGSIRFVKPALKNELSVKNVSDTSRSLVGRRSVGRRPVDFRQKPPVDVLCLDMLPTMGGVDSALHSIFGQMNSSGLYVCNNVKIFRQHLANFIRQNATSPTYPKEQSNQIELAEFSDKKEKHGKVSAFVKQFVLRVHKSNALDYPVAFDVKNAYFEHRRTNSEENEFNWQNATECQKLFEEYAMFVETPSNSLESSEMELLAIIYDETVHVYNDQLSSFKYSGTLNPDVTCKEHYIIHHENGEWQLAEPNLMATNLCNQIEEDFFEYQPIQTDCFRKFLYLLEKHNAKQQVIDSLKTLDPENGDIPDKLFQLLLKIFQENEESGENSNVEWLDEYSIDLCWLAEWIAEHNSRNLSPIFYLSIVNNISPVDWRCDFVMLEIYDRFSLADSDILDNGDIHNWLYQICNDIQDWVFKIAKGKPSLVPLLRKSVATSDSCSALLPQNLLRLMELIATYFEQDDGITSQHLPELELLPLGDWYHYLKSKMWEKKVDGLTIGDSSSSSSPEFLQKENKKLKNEAVYMLLELEFENKKDFCDKLLETSPDLKTVVILLKNALYPEVIPSQEYVERNIDDIIKEMMEKDMPQNNEPGNSVISYHTTLLATLKKKVKESKSMSDQMTKSDEQEHSLSEKRIKKLIKQWQKNGLELNDKSVVDFVCAYDYAVQKTCTKKGGQERFRLRDTQRLTIMALLTSKKIITLMQVSTGEGKSLIVTGVAIAIALCRNEDNKCKKIDVITSNDVLARRDSTLSVADGGLRDLYEYFNVSVANNCSQWVDERTQAYNAAVVYGQFAYFQRDYLLDEFYGHDIRGDRTRDLIIIDEVDCMLLDRGNSVLYLSHDIPGMEMLESLYVFIWEKIRSSSIGSDKLAVQESVKSAVLHDLYGVISKDDFESISDSLKDKPSEKNALWDHLIEKKVINSQGHLLIESNIENIKFKPQMDPKIRFYLRSVAKRERNIQIPTHLMSFVELHIDTWLNNAMKALELQRDEDYVVDQDRTDTSPDLNPQVIIIDKDTGIDQISSQWDGALHQFIQLKEGCKLTSQNLKSIFVVNTAYITTYVRVAGVSGTLGSKTEQLFMRENYRNRQIVIPTAFKKRFYLKPAKVFKSKDHWLHAIVKEARQIIRPGHQNKARSIVIFCQSIKNVNIVHSYLKNAVKSELNDNHIHCYTRDYEKFVFEGKSLEVGHVIIATNLAGRGTDIKISEQLKENGGLHICLTFLPKNERIEEQAMGRSARNGAPGSGVFLLYEESSSGKKWGTGKWFSMKEERHWKERLRISCLKDEFSGIENEQSCFDKFLDYYIELERELESQNREDQEIKTLSDSVLDKWALWLDQSGDPIKLSLSYCLDILHKFPAGLGLPEFKTTDTNWMTPIRSLAMAKHLARQKSSQSQTTAVEILNRVIASKDGSLYPAAHYYLAFILFEENFEDNKKKFIQILQTCETILNNHINMHLSFYRRVAHAAPEQTPSFCVVDAYKQQKNNMVKILEYFIGSVRALLGSHYCSASNLKEAGRDAPEKLGLVKMKMKEAETFIQKKIASHFSRFQKKRKLNDEPKRHKIRPERADELFQLLVKGECISCQLNDIHTVPDRNDIIQEVADEYGIYKLLENLESVFGENLIEEQIEKKLKEKNLIPCTRKAFWEKLKKASALEAVKDGLCSQMKCVIVLESECDVEPSKPNSQKLDRDKRIKIEDFQFGLDSFDRNCLNVLYNPIYDNMNDLLEQKKIMFRKQYVIEQLGKEEYRRRKEKFESNQIAQLNLDKLESVSLKFSGPLGKHDLDRVNIKSSDEQDGVWNALVDQEIIDSNGKLLPNFQKFSYPECPAYEKPVMRVIGRTFVAEIVKRQWLRLKAEKDPNYLKAINLLPLKPYRDMLGDLMAAHIISGARVTEDTELIEEKTKELEDEDERECVRKFLKSRQAVYAPKMKKCDIYLDLIEMDIRKIPNTENISTELHSFDLVGFNHVIDIKDREMSWKTYLGAIVVGAVGFASIGGGVFLIHEKLLSIGLSKNLLFMGGASDILYAITTILTRSNFTWADYTRQRLMSAIGKAEPMDAIKTIFKLYSSTENADFREAIQLAVGEERWKRQGRSQTERDSEVESGGTLERIGLKKHKNEFYFHSQLHYLLQDFGIFVHGKTNKCLAKNLNEIRERLAQFNELHGLETSQHFVREKMNKIISDWTRGGRKWVCEITTAMTSKLDEIHMVLQQTGGIPLTQEIADEGIREMEPIFHDYQVRIRLIRVTITCISEFLSDLKNYDKPKVARVDDIGVEEAFKRFQERTLADIEAELKRQVDKILDSLRQQIHRVASNQVSNLANINSEIFTTFLQFT